MKFIFKLLILLIVFLIAFIIFFPKELAYNYLEKELEKNRVIVSNEIRKEDSFNLKIKNADVYYDGIKAARIKKISLTTFLFYNKVKIEDVAVLEALKRMVPTPINEATIEYSILDFKNINIDASGSFGELEGKVDIFEKKITLYLKASSKMKSSYSNILSSMKKVEGRYVYEYRY